MDREEKMMRVKGKQLYGGRIITYGGTEVQFLTLETAIEGIVPKGAL